MNFELIKTRSGHWAMRDAVTDEVMHPGVGPLEEAQRLYVEQSRLAVRLSEKRRETVVVFDVGLGAGSNAAAAWRASAVAPTHAARLELVSFERDLGALSLALRHGEAFGLVGDVHAAASALMHEGEHRSQRTTWRLRAGDALKAFCNERARADIVFWDPYSPKSNPALWMVDAFTRLKSCAADEATVFTYSRSTKVRLALLLAGWSVGEGAAVGHKASTTAAARRTEDLRSPLGRDWLMRRLNGELCLPTDAASDATECLLAHPQFA